MTPLDIMRQAAALGSQAPQTQHELSVGCIITDAQLNILSTGYSREDGNPKSHAEKIALEKLPAHIDMTGLHLFSTVEPCGTRLSDNPTCASLIVKYGIRHVYYGVHEPDHFVHQNGLDHMRTHNVNITHICDDQIFQSIAKANPHIRWQR